MTVILGINSEHAGASAALVVDGLPVAAIAEERLNRVKYYAGFPRLAVRSVLGMAGLGPQDIDCVAIPRDPAANLSRKAAFLFGNPDASTGPAKNRRRPGAAAGREVAAGRGVRTRPGCAHFPSAARRTPFGACRQRVLQLTL